MPYTNYDNKYPFLLIILKQCIRKKAAEMENSRGEELGILRERISSLQVSEDRV